MEDRVTEKYANSYNSAVERLWTLFHAEYSHETQIVVI